jgi:hypothetical protein
MGRRLTDFDGAKSDHSTITFIDSPVDLLQIIRIGDNLITCDNILYIDAVSTRVQTKCRRNV